jgi:hypothetical protein
MSGSRKASRSIPALFALAVAGSCGESTEPRGPGAIAVSASVQSQDNFFQYGIAIDNGTPRLAFVGEQVAFTQTGLAHGAHTVSVVDVPPACSGAVARQVSLRGDDTAAVAFTIVCPRTTGDLRITVTTTGNDLDTEYLLTLNGSAVAEVPVNATVTFNALPPGTYTIGLADVEPNCVAPASQQGTVTQGQLTTLTFNVTCTAVGVLRFVSSASGDDRDPDGFLVTVGTNATHIASSATTNIRVPLGTHSYTTSDLQANCIASGPTSGTHTFAAGDTITVTLSLACTAVPSGTAGVVTVSEAAGDTTAKPANRPGGYDVIGMNARYADGFLMVAVRFHKPLISPATGDPAALYGYLELDVDENSSTGMPAIANQFGGNSTHGVDYLVDIFTTDTASAELYRTPNEQTVFDAGRVRVRVDADSIVVLLPLAKLENDDGSMTMTMVFGTGDRPTDIVPNAGQAGARPQTPLRALRGSGTSAVRVVLDPARLALPKAGTWRRNR